MKDKEIEEAIHLEEERQRLNIELIASENFVSKEVREAVGSVLTNKYAEGYPGKRYYGGCQDVDLVEELARTRVCTLFQAEHANVQPHSGSQANMAVYMAVLQPGDCVMGMDLAAGGHLTHGSPLSFSGKLYDFHPYGVGRDTEMLDYDEIEAMAKTLHPKMIVCGASAYSRIIDFERFSQIAQEVGAYLMVDMAHIAGLVATGEHPSPIPYADFVTSTTHKTLRGPRGGLVLCKEAQAKALDKALFPGIQGGPLMHVIAGKAVCFYEALQPSFKVYCHQIVLNAQALARTLREEGFRLVAGGTDNHLLLVDVKASLGMSGKEAEQRLDAIHITANKNSIPFDQEKPTVTSGIRLGTAAMTTRGFKEKEFEQVGHWIARVLKNPEEANIQEVEKEVLTLMAQVPVV